MKVPNNRFFALAFAALAVLTTLGAVSALAPTLSSIATYPDTTTAYVKWTANQTSYNTTVYYGLTASLGSTATNATNGTSLSVTLSGLETAETYYFSVRSCDNATVNACTTSAVSTFETLCSTSDDVAIDCDTIEGLPEVGTDLGDFLKNLAPGIGAFILIMGVFVGIGFIVVATARHIQKVVKFK